MAQMFLLLGAMLALLALGIFVGRRCSDRSREPEEIAPVTRQHIDLFQGGQLSEPAVEAAKARIRALLGRGQSEMVEASLRRGIHYAIQVRALAEIGTDEAGRMLERQLHRR